MIDRTNRVAIVTGGSSGIGRAIVERFLSDGILVAMISRNPSKLQTESKALLKIRSDVTEPKSVKLAIEKTCRHFRSSSVDILVNNAGVSGPIKPTSEISLNEWNETLAVNLTGAFICSKYVIPKMVVSKYGGRIVNISSMVGKNSVSFRAAYSASKMALIGFTRALSAELGSYGITVNAVSPGPVEGKRIDEVIAASAKARGQSKEEVRKRMIERTSLKRMARSDEVAQVVSFLVSPEAASITGQDTYVNA
ncbi:MAG: SDR family oxidoreductase [Thaumarchaeota archaeon]|nr:SDR family oxidoreductase [Nitrososphaerota archaeon]